MISFLGFVIYTINNPIDKLTINIGKEINCKIDLECLEGLDDLDNFDLDLDLDRNNDEYMDK